jgi:hypothetical protein
MIRFTLAAVVLIAAAGSVPAAERPPLRKQPSYASKEPLYAVLAFGPKAEHRMWLVLDLPYDPLREKPGAADCLYVDRTGTGDLTAPGCRVPVEVRAVQEMDWKFSKKAHDRHIPVFKLPDVPGPDGKPRYTNLTLEVQWYVPGQRYRQMDLKVTLPDGGEQWAGGPLLRFAGKPEDAPVIHFDGPLAMRLNMSNGLLHCPVDYSGKEAAPPWYEDGPLYRGQKCEITAQIGTTGLGRGTFVPVTANVPPKELHPVAEVSFPNADPAKPPVTVRVELDSRCCGTLFKGKLVVPPDAALGKAKLTLRYPAWAAGSVADGTGEVTVDDAPKK